LPNLSRVNMPTRQQIQHSADEEDKYDYYLAFSVQATCNRHHEPQPVPKEIIEISAVIIHGQRMDIFADFHEYVKPKTHRELSKFCKALTGATQGQIDRAPELDECMKNLDEWLREKGLFKEGKKFAVVMHSDWILKTLLPNCLETYKCEVPKYFKQWINVSTLNVFKEKGVDVAEEIDEVMAMINVLGLEKNIPRHGFRACDNLIMIMKRLYKDHENIFHINSSAPRRPAT